MLEKIDDPPAELVPIAPAPPVPIVIGQDVETLNAPDKTIPPAPPLP